MIPESKLHALLNKKFLTDIIGEGIKEYAVSTGSKQQGGDNVASRLLKIDIKTNSHEILHIIIKTPPYDAPAQLTYAKRWRIFELENHFYSSLLPQLEQLLREKNEQKPSTPEAPLPIPKYFGGTDEYLVLDDVRPLGFKMTDKFKGLNLPEVSIVLQNLAKFHATTYTFLCGQGNKFFEQSNNKLFLNMITQLKDPPQLREKCAAKFGRIYSTACEILGTRNPSLATKIGKLSPIAHSLMIATYEKTDVKYFPVISHGDLWQGNLLFNYGHGHKEEVEVKFLDFQQTRRDNIFFDLSYFLFTSTTPQFRRQHLVRVLVHDYYEGFVHMLNFLDSPIPPGFTRGWLVDEFFDNLPNIFTYLSFAIPMQLGDYAKLGLSSPKPVKDLSDENLLTFDDFIEQTTRLPAFLLEHSPAALDRFEAVAAELDEMGVFDKFQ